MNGAASNRAPSRWVTAALMAATATTARPMQSDDPQTAVDQELTIERQTPFVSRTANELQAIPLPPLQSDPPETVHANSCAIVLTGDHVAMDLAVTPSGETPALLLEGGLFGWTGPNTRYPNRHFPELQIRVDGASGTIEERYEAFIGSRNISTMLRLMGMDPLAVVHTPPLTTAELNNAPQLKALVNVGAVKMSGDGYLAKWQVRRIVRIPLVTAPVHRLTLEYQALPAVSVLNLQELDTASREKSYCLSPAKLRRLPHARSVPAWLASEYVLPTGIDQKTADTMSFTMSPGVGADAVAKAYVFFCGAYGKPTATQGAVDHAGVNVDELGNLHVLRLSESAAPAHLLP